MVRNNDIGNCRYFEYYAIFLTMSQITAISLFGGDDLYSFVIRISILVFIPFFVPYLKKDLNFVGLLYCRAISFVFFPQNTRA